MYSSKYLFVYTLLLTTGAFQVMKSEQWGTAKRQNAARHSVLKLRGFFEWFLVFETQ